MLKETAKTVLPPLVLTWARSLVRFVRYMVKHIRARRAPVLHKRLLARHRGSHPIRVVFLISNTASWKVGPVFVKMMQSPEFQPVAVVCPVTNGTLATESRHNSILVCRYLQAHGFPYVNLTGLKRRQAIEELRKIDPQLVFFTNPHGLVPKYLHDDLLYSKLTCYVPYSHEVMAYGNNQEQYNQNSHNAFWRIFVPHEESRRYYETTRIRGDDGVIVTGFPACEPLLAHGPPRVSSPWNQQQRPKKRVIYAPHWLWRSDIKMSTINTFGSIMMDLAEKYRDEVQWALRPHPMLRPRLMTDSEWGPERANKFFEFWQKSEYCQIHEDDYLPLFHTSDALIHDSGSFLAEYLYLRKPAMYLMTEQTGDKYFNSFGRRALAAYDIGRCAEEIERFILKILTENAETVKGDKFYKEDIEPYFQKAPSSKICHEIRRAFS